MNGKKQKPNYRKEYWVSIRLGGDNRIYIDGNMTYYSDIWSKKSREYYERMTDYIINGNSAVMYIIDWDELGYDRCEECAFEWVKGNVYVYRLDFDYS